MAKNERKDLTSEEEEWLTDMPVSDPVTDAVVEAMAEDEEALNALKAKLPMLYTARGNLIKRKTRAVTGKNFGTHRRVIDQLNETGNHLILFGDGWNIELDIPTSDALRLHGQVESLYLAGWEISLV